MVVGRILPRPFHQLAAAFEADHLGGARGDRQGEIAEPAEQVRDALAGLRIEQPHGARHEDAVDGVVDLCEVSRAEPDAQAEFRQIVVQLAAFRVKGVRRVRRAGLEPDMDGIFVAEAAKERKIVFRQRQQMPEHQHGRVVAGRHLDLRHPLPDRELLDQVS